MSRSGPGERGKAPDSPSAVRSAGTPVIYGIRHAHIGLASGGVAAEALVVEPTGEAQEVRARIGTTEISVVIRDAELLSPGQQIGLGIDPAKVLVFDKASGKGSTGEFCAASV